MVISRKEIESLQEEAMEIHGKFRHVRKSLKKDPDNEELRKKKTEYRERLEELEDKFHDALKERRVARRAADAKRAESSDPTRRHPQTLEERKAQLAERKRARESSGEGEDPPKQSQPAKRADLAEANLDADLDDSYWVLSNSQALQPQRFEVGQSKFRKRVIVPPSNWFVVTFIRIFTTIRMHPIRILLLLILVVVVPVGGIMKYKLRIHEVTSKNAEPTLEIGDKVLVWVQTSYRRGDLVVVPDPYTPRQVLTRRVVAVAGDEIELRDRRLFVNDVEVYEPYVTKRASFDFQFGPMEIAPGKVYAISDNRSLAPDDTMSYMDVSIDSIEGKILFRYFPRLNAGFLE